MVELFFDTKAQIIEERQRAGGRRKKEEGRKYNFLPSVKAFFRDA